MPITFQCPTCNSRMTVPDTMAGKRGKCRKCQTPIQVPGNAIAASVPAPSPSPAAPSPTTAPDPEPATINKQGEIVRNSVPPPPPLADEEDVEAAALAALADEPKKSDDEEPTDQITFNCPQCDESVTLSIDLAGKKHPCPSCRRIIAVPRPA